MANKVYIATSIDGYIANKAGCIEWLHELPNPDQNDFGYAEFMQTIDALVMGRNTFEKVLSFDIAWPYEKKVFVLSSTLKEIPSELGDSVELVLGTPLEITRDLKSRGFANLYIDGGQVIQSFIRDSLIDEMIISTLPILLGEGIPLFRAQPKIVQFEHVQTKSFPNGLVQTHYLKKKI